MNDTPITVHQITTFRISNFEGTVSICFHFLNLNMLQVLLLNLPESTNIRMEIYAFPPGREQKTWTFLGTLGSGFGFGLDSGTCQQPKSGRKIGGFVPPNHPILIVVFHYKPSILGETSLFFGNTHMFFLLFLQGFLHKILRIIHKCSFITMVAIFILKITS